jgi:tetratricopeptide (TPR) repeat protein
MMLTLLSAFLPQISANADNNTASDFERAMMQMRSQDYAGAVATCNKTLQAHPRNQNALLLREQAYIRMGKFKEALNDATKFSAIDPKNTRGFRELAMCYLDSGKYSQALEMLNKVMSVQPSEQAHLLRADCNYHLGRYGQVADDLAASYEVFPGTPGAHELRANALNLVGKYQDGLAQLLEMFYVSNVDTTTNPSATLRFIRKYPNIAGDWNKQVAAHPKQAGVWCGRGVYRLLCGDFHGAVDDLTKALSIDPKFLPALWPRAIAYVRLSKDKEGYADVDRLIALAPNSPLSYRILDRYFYLANKQEQCLQDLTQRIKKTPNNVNLFVARAHVNFILEHLEAAIKDYSDAIKIKPACAEAYAGRGEVFLSMKNMKNALDDLSQAHKLDPKNTDALSNRAMVYIEEKDFAKAAQDLTILIQLHYKLCKTYEARGQCYMKMGKRAEASADSAAVIWISG